jgi:hypothetical protein
MGVLATSDETLHTKLKYLQNGPSSPLIGNPPLSLLTRLVFAVPALQRLAPCPRRSTATWRCAA